MKKMTKNKRDWILIVGATLIIGIYFAISTWFITYDDSTAANVYYGNNNQPIVVIDFVNEKITIEYQQENAEMYPKVDLINQTITLLGDYKVQGVRQEVVIGYSFINKTVEILEEESPYHICSNQGASDRQALICLPNAIRVEFTNTEIDFII
jgi:hypothetical protein